MRKTLACVCVIALLPTGVLGQAPGEPPPSPAPSPLSRSIASAIAAVPLDAPVPPLAGDQDRDEASGWLRVEALQPGTEVTLTVTGTPAVKARLLVASHGAVFVLRPGGPNVSGRVSRALIGVGSQWPAVFSGGAAYSLADGVRVADGGVFDGNRRVADLDQVVQRAPREDVREIRVAGKRKGNTRRAAVGAGAGFLVGAYIGLSMSDKYCGSSCSDEKALVGLSVVGLPVALGLLGYYGGSHSVGGMIYRAPPPAGDGPDGPACAGFTADGALPSSEGLGTAARARIAMASRLTAIIALALAPAMAAGQEPVATFDLLEKRLTVGETIWVTDVSGREFTGTAPSD